MSEILPYYYPTTVCFVDDNASYLESLTLHLPENWPYRIFHSGHAALQYVNRAERPNSLADRCFTPIPGQPDTQLALDLSLIEGEIARPNRFEDVSVMVVDYAMPTLNGLEMCAKIADPNVQIVLLTGVADEAVAVQAFNAGLIHRYIRKGKTELQPNTFAIIEQMRRDYIAKCTAGLFAGLRALPTSFRQDANFQRYFDQVLHKQGITEYYLVTEPSGYLLIDVSGNFRRLVVLQDFELASQHQLLVDFDAPADVQQSFKAGKTLGYFYEHPADYVGEAYPWNEMMVPAEQVVSVDGSQTWHVGIHDHPPIDIDFDLSQSSLDHYLNHLDPLTGQYTEQSRRAARRQAALQAAKE